MTKTLILIRGLPGSGKSTLAKALCAQNGYAHLEADMYWGPEYKFDYTKIHMAHSWCRKQVEDKFRAGESVVVSNTFTKAWEAEPYVQWAKYYDYDIQVIEAHGTWENVHSVPQSALDNMKARWQRIDKFLKDLGLDK